ncbi:unnamed protein product [Thlaspi arvense]|uniref:DYW domain-containing protein n=1 Tax=Thlaspi arvense TaxID=13288 RepID=A0AAU9SQG7_THLAR|nr:unnamed protein product [Thlaspi arvense]
MEIPLAFYQSLRLDENQSNSRESCYSNPKVFNFPRFSGYDFSLRRRRWKNPFARITCSSLVQGLKPKPRLKSEPIRETGGDDEGSKGPVLDETQIRKSGVRICSQIEKFVLCNRFREAFELFEILEIRGSFRVGYMKCWNLDDENRQIYQKVDEVMEEISGFGYSAGERNVLPDVEEEERRVVRYHSEKLAIAYGLVNTPEWNQLQITQNHRICRDCHKVVEFISLVTGREIVVRDASRFHHFKEGKCSCGGYW